MNRKAGLSVACLALASAACVPMEQAALTYTSKTTLGVGVAAGTPDTPGLDVTLGFKETNVAMVPVAVAKYCYKASADQCQRAIYEMQLIAGGKLDSVESPPVEARITEIDTELKKLIDQQKPETEQLSNLKSQLALVDAADAAQAELATLGAAVDGEAPEVQSKRAELTSKAAVRPASFDAAKARADVARLEAARAARTARIEEFGKEQSRLIAQSGPDQRKSRQDAFSVYGKFSGGANGGGTGGGLTAGKVFATGVAAQNLTERDAVADCLANIRFLAELMPEDKAAERTALLGTAATVCKPSAPSS